MIASQRAARGRARRFRRWVQAALCLPILLFAGCAGQRGSEGPPRPFVFGADTLSFANELRAEYAMQADGRMAMLRKPAPPEFSLRCFPMVRMAREFHHHAAFDPAAARGPDEMYRGAIKAVVARDSRHRASESERVRIPGFANLRQLSGAHPKLLQAACGGAWRSYFQRGNWRMILPFTRSGQARTAAALARSLAEGGVPIVHVVDFPALRLNHALLLYQHRPEESGEPVFAAYDPNEPDQPLELRFDPVRQSFVFPRTRYFPGGRVNVYEVYRSAVR